MPGFSSYMQTQIINWVKGTAMPAAPSALYVALYNGDPTDAGTGGTDVTTQVRAAGRVAVTLGTETNGSVSNSAVVNFGNAANAVASVTHFGIWTAASGGQLIASGSINGAPRSITQGSPVTFEIGALVLTVS